VEAAGRQLDRADAARVECDAAMAEPGGRNTITIPPRTRRAVLARDRHRCRTPGCHHTRFLEVHHIVPRSRGGTNEAANLITLCSACHRLWHERGRPGWFPGGQDMSAREECRELIR
jgi:5-methylcytosine-specific restriction endonuclease McrA